MGLRLTENMSREAETSQVILTRLGESGSAVGVGEELRLVIKRGSE
jgi:hypothetical protein